MERVISNLIFSSLVVSSLMVLHCGMAVDPTDPSKTNFTAVFKNAESVIFGNSFVETAGKQLSIGAALYLPKNFDSISLVIKENGVVTTDTTFKTFRAEYFYDTVWCTRTFSSEGIKNVTLTPFSSPSLQPLAVNIQITAAQGEQVHVIYKKGTTSATGTMPIQTCTAGETITLSDNIFVNPGYSFSGWATTATGSVEYTDKDEITLGTEDLLLYAVWVDQNSDDPVIVHAPSQLIAGKADTLLFTVDNSSRSEPITISLITDSPLDPAVFSIVPTEPDTIMIAIAQSAQPVTDSIGIITYNGTKSDTSWYPVTLISPNDALWNTTSLNADAVEGVQYKLDLSQYLSDANGEGVSFSADIGTIESTTWSYTPEWGCAEDLAATITAEKGDKSLALSLNITVAAGDNKKPQLSLVDESLDGKMVNSSQLNVECKVIDEGAGVDSVVFTYGEQKITGTLQGENVYSGVITGLVHKTPAQITITATDKSRLKNSETLTFTVTRDSTVLDVEPPVIVQTSGPVSGARVNSSKDTLTFTVTDNSGVDSVWWTLNDAFVAAVSTSGDNKYTITYTLSDFGKNVIKLYAKDGSSSGNEGSQTIILNYNTEPAEITLTSPEANATAVSTSPTFKWSGGDDADGDGVTFTVKYGTSQANLSSTATVNEKTAALSSSLEYAKTYYWQVTAKSSSAEYPDEVLSSIGTFTTEGSLPTISANPQSQSVEEGQSVPFSLTAAGFGTLLYQWRENGSNISGATDASYTISSVDTSMNGNKYDCVVTNEVGSDTSTAATLTVTEIPTYTVSFYVQYGSPTPASQNVKRGEHSTRPSEVPLRDGYEFTDWYVENASHEFYFDQTPITADLQLVAGWNPVVYTITYNLNGGTNGSNPATYKITDATITLQNPGKDGSVFGGWYSDVNFSTKVTSIPSGSTGNKVFYAKWEINAPNITTSITDKTCPVNDVVTFSVVATGANLSYTWQLNGETISNATGSNYTTSSLTVNDVSAARTYKCIVTNSAGSKECSAALSVSTVNDIDGNVYHQVKIGTQVWMMENLKTTHYRDGTAIKEITSGTDWADNLYNAVYCWPDFSSSAQAYGAMYNYYAANDSKLPPSGWRVPTEDEWMELFNVYSGEGCRYISDETYWDIYPCGSSTNNNSTGFSARANGYLIVSGNGENAYSSGLRQFAGWWTSSVYNKRCYLAHNLGWSAQIGENGDQDGFGIRCIKE